MESAAVSGAQWVVSKALSSLSDGLVEAWAASSELGPNIEALKMELLYAQAMLENARGREIRSLALVELLQRLRGLAYGAEDALDELDYFRIQDELEGTFETVDGDGRGCVHDLARDARHTAKAASRQLGCATSFFSADRGTAGDPYKQLGEEGGRRKGQLCGAWPCGGAADDESCKCVRRLASRARTTAHAVGKRLLCSSLLPVRNDQGDDSERAPRVPKLKFDRVDVSRRMKCIVEQLQPVCAKVSTILDLELLGSIQLQLLASSHSNIGNGNSTSRPTTTSHTIEPKLYGRDHERNTIVEDITKGAYTHRDLTVIPIVGPGGIGKTTLTQYIYNEVQDHFQIRVWVCVSLDFSVYRLTQEILKSLPKSDHEKNDTANNKLQNLDQLQKLVETRVKNKRLLLVLDDIWKYGNEDEWKRLLLPFKNEHANGNVVLVTTRFPEVAKIVRIRTTDKSLPLEGLEPKEYWNFFVACVFDETNEQYKDSNLLDVGKKIVEKLKGSPLAAKTVGRLLRNNLTLDQWTRVLESKEWESQINDHDIMPALKLSYDYLPFHLQQSFSYCALFPDDYKFDHEELIRFWIGLDILRPGPRTKRIEDIGLDNLNELVNYGFFKKETDDLGTHYVMHDLLHDLALKVSSQECLHIVSSSPRTVEVSPSIYHLSISMSPTNSEDGIIEEKFRKELGKIRNRLKSENLHTLMLFGEYDESFVCIFCDLFKDAKFLRVIHLSTMTYPLESILHNFSKLLHLRYLRVASAYYSKQQLPRSLSRFYHLRVLDIRQHSSTRKLHGDMTNLVKLRHFLVPSSSGKLHSNISHVGKLNCLQELMEFEVRKESNGFELRELGQLEELGGSLAINNLEKVQVNEAHEAKLLYKNCLQRLTLNWMADRSNKNPDIEGQVLLHLRPHTNLCELSIHGHGGLTCPTWLGTDLSITGLEALHLNSVDWKILPPLGELRMISESGEEYFGCVTGPNFHNLKRLELVGLPKFTKWIAKEVYPAFFSLLEVLVVKDCSKLTELPFSYNTCYPPEGDEKANCFPRLAEIHIEDCPKLLLVPPIPYTHTLRFVYMKCVGRGLELLEYSNKRMSLQIQGNEALHNLDDTVLVFHHLTQLQYLQLTKCPPIAEEHLQMLTSLKTLKIDGLSNVFPVLARSDIKWQLPVNTLWITECSASGKELTQLLSHLPKLSKLIIVKYKKILLPSSSTVAKLKDTHEAGQQQEIAQEVEKEQVAEQLVVEQQQEEEEEDGLLLLGSHLSDSLQELVIIRCSDLILTAMNNETGGGGLQFMRSLKKMEISNCPKFLSAYKPSGLSSWCPFPSSLQKLTLNGRMEGMETLVPLSNLTSLESLHVENWGEDLRCEGMWPLLTRGQLSNLHIYGSPGFFVGWDLTWGLLDEQDRLLLSSKPRELCTDGIAGVLAAPICIILSSFLTKLVFSNTKVEFCTKEQEEALSLFTSLQELEFGFSFKLRCLPTGLNKLTNLKRLEICNCSAIRSLPKNGLPSSLEELDVHDCGNEELKHRCRKLIGTIPRITL